MGAKILVIDDSPTICNTVEWVLCDNGYEVVIANDGLTALNHISEHQPDLILLDIRLPHVDGYFICELLRQNPNYAYVPIVMLSGLSRREDIQRAIEVGASAFIQKPVKDDVLLDVIAAHLAAVGV